MNVFDVNNIVNESPLLFYLSCLQCRERKSDFFFETMNRSSQWALMIATKVCILLLYHTLLKSKSNLSSMDHIGQAKLLNAPKNSLFQYSRLNVDYQASPTLLRIIDQCLNNKNGFQHRFPSSRSRNRKPFQPTEKPVAEILVKCTGRYAYLIR